MSDFEARLHQITDLHGMVKIQDVMELLGRCQLRGQTQTFRETRIGKDAADECLKGVLRNIALTVLLGKGGRIHKVDHPLSSETTVELRMEILKWG